MILPAPQIVQAQNNFRAILMKKARALFIYLTWCLRFHKMFGGTLKNC